MNVFSVLWEIRHSSTYLTLLKANCFNWQNFAGSFLCIFLMFVKSRAFFVVDCFANVSVNKYVRHEICTKQYNMIHKMMNFN